MSLTVDRLESDACLLIKMPCSMNGTWTTCSSKEGAPIWYRKHYSLLDHSCTSVACWKGRYLLVKWPTLQAPRMSRRIYMYSQVLKLSEPESSRLMHFNFALAAFMIIDNLLQLTMLTIPAISSGIRVFCGRKWQAAITGRNDVQQKQGVRNQNYLQRFMFSHSSEFTTKCTRFIWRLSLFVQIFKTTSL